VIIEPIQGDAGIVPAQPIFMKKLYDLCRENGILFIAEEVQQGFFRAGKWFPSKTMASCRTASFWASPSAPVLTLGAFMGKSEIMDCLPAPAHLFTLGGSSIACAAGIAAFDYYKTDEFQKRLSGNMVLLEAEAASLMAENPDIIHFVRGAGMSMGIGICRTAADGSREPDPDGTFKILFRCYELGLSSSHWPAISCGYSRRWSSSRNCL
jgi:4-aminobutyrate aminotransferase